MQTARAALPKSGASKKTDKMAHPFGFTSAAVDSLFTNGERAAGKFKVVRVNENSSLLPDVIELLARSECGTTSTAPDPLLHWVYSGKTTAGAPLSAPPSGDRMAWFRWLTEYCCLFAISRGGLYALLDPASRKVLGAAVTAPPSCVGLNEMSEEEAGIYCQKAGM